MSMLSPREQQVLALVSRGLTNADAGLELGIGQHAVKFHLASIYRKLGVGNRTEAATVYVRATVGS
jgi:DNA-binding CsgD family transcriptional regulator